jgi:trans-2,3-dihydro-3-hydroxyanthranilate isomerase
MENDKMKYLHADVFSNKSLKGNGLTIIYTENNNTDDLQKIAFEFKQFETVFIYEKFNDFYPIRIFTVEEELDFAGHPILGASAAVLKEN